MDSCLNMPSREESSSILLGGAVIKIDCEIVLVDDAVLDDEVVESVLVDAVDDGVVAPLLLDLSTLSSCRNLPCVELGQAVVFLGGDEVHALAKITRFLVWVMMRQNTIF